MCEKSVSPKELTIYFDHQSLDKLVKSYFQLDSLGISVNKGPSSADKRAIEILEGRSRYLGNEWETGLLWKRDSEALPDSRQLAKKRLFSIERKLDRDPKYAALYYKEMNRLFECGYAIYLPEVNPNVRQWYLPHFGVTNASKPDRLRLVFDAAAKSSGVSLNDQLLTGPGLLKSLFGVLMRFRQQKIAIKADINDMFLKVKINRNDRESQRFLWRGKDRKGEPKEFAMTTVLFGAKSSPSTAIYIKDKHATEFAGSKPKAAQNIVRNSYMDDFLASVKTEKEDISFVRDVIEINAAADFVMHGWASNNEKVVKVANGQTTAEKIINVHVDKDEKVLGLFWDTRTDNLKFKIDEAKIPVEILNFSGKPTKRQFLGIMMSISDLLGFLAPFTIQSRIIMQEIWISGIKWDEKLRVEQFGSWKIWLTNLRKIKECSIPRFYFHENREEEDISLHLFCDASKKSYAAVAYWHFSANKEGPARVSFVASKSRVAPVKPLSIPRLELQAALLSTRLAKSIEKEHEFQVKQTFFWSDSSTVLSWLKSDPRSQPVFVAHRLGEIQESTENCEWRWVPSKSNPADDASKNFDAAFESESRWFKGPSFLRQPVSSWPVTNCDESIRDPESEQLEVSDESARIFVTVIEEREKDYLPTYKNFSSWPRLLRATACLLASIDRLRRKTSGKITLKNLESAECIWVREIQQACFHSEIMSIKKEEPVNKHRKIATLTPMLDKKGILRVNGRLRNLPKKIFENQPIILNIKHYITRLIVRYYNEKFDHGSFNTVMNELRQKYWITGLRTALRTIISRCVICKKLRARAENPMMSNLPLGRLAFKQFLFTHCGIDFFGPLLVKIGRRQEKRWGVIFTCLTIRAIHLELASSLTTDSAIMAIQRMSARRGNPTVMYSDNGTNLRGACKELKLALAGLDQYKLRDYGISNNFDWKFNPPIASHMGGVWERLIKSVKTYLQAALTEHIPREEVLTTVFAEVEHIVNSRPLTKLSIDPQDEEALTHNHFLIGRSSGVVNYHGCEKSNFNIRKQWRVAQHMTDVFWKRWQCEYLPLLLARQKWVLKDKPLHANDVVLLMDNQAPRNLWRKGVIIKTFPSPDGQVRIAEVRTASGIFTRGTRYLIKLLDCEVQND